ncbi:CIA30 family protein [Maribacter sp. M208]|uniref:CIA30 family protein n=1 Tax=Maribacter huludaoensis TaxID=3030010 RepID=UPI0023EBFC5E|nr:CIA30 family protein [Maribacter huludaoensis]MDF4222735.1 CIA30 family protein [Maribacter huludaoensis]
MSEIKTLYKFDENFHLKDWQIVNDDVMGGLSMGLIQVNKEGFGVFSGHVSLENNGGFCMVRRNVERMHVNVYTKFLLSVKGDGKRYAFRCKSGEHQRHTYSYEFTSTKDWTTIEIPFKDMQAVFRGEELNLPNYHGDYLTQIAIIIKNGIEEDFVLEIDKIEIK